jgi:flagellar biosynthesis protein FlhF
MKVKRYVVSNMKEALQMIKQDLGSDAVIVSSRRIREAGLRGWISPAKLEITAAIEQSYYGAADGQPETDESPGLKLANRPNALAAHKINQCLLKIEVEPDIITYLLEDIDAVKNYQEMKEFLRRRLQTVFKTVPAPQEKPRIMAFVGVPGVGKTTTIAKIAAIHALFNNSSISLITIDTFRVGAVEQMRIYAEILGASFDVVSSPEELREAVQENQDKDLILIDTAGRPPKNRFQLLEIKTFLEVVKELETYLVISAATRFKDVMHLIDEYKIIPYHQLIVTKIDETEYPGILLNVAYLTGLPIAYVTNGQNVPDDLETANPELLADYIMKDVVY